MLGSGGSQVAPAASTATTHRRRLGFVASTAMLLLVTAGLVTAGLLAWEADRSSALDAWQSHVERLSSERDFAAAEAAQLRLALVDERAAYQRELNLAQLEAEQFAAAESQIRQADARVAELAGNRAQLIDGQVQLQLLAATNAEAARRALECLLSDPPSGPTRCQPELAKASSLLGYPLPR